MIEDIIRLNSLYDYYGNLLSDTQRKSFYYYYRMDYSLSEIGDDLDISKQAVSENLKRAVKELENFEENLKLLKKSNHIKTYINEIKSSLDGNKEKDKIILDLVDKIVEELED